MAKQKELPPDGLINCLAGRYYPDADGRKRLTSLAADQPDLKGLLAEKPKVKAMLGAVATASPFLFALMQADAERLLRLLTSDPADSHKSLLTRMREEVADADEATAMRLLRRARGESALLIALADLGGAWTCEQTVRALSEFACETTSIALDLVLRDAVHAGRIDLSAGRSGLAIIGMGKLGAGELNYSSDIDIIAFYDPDIAPLAAGVEPATFFTRAVQRLTKILSERNADGYVARVDLRLRPDPGSMPVAVSHATALRYYESVGQNWERAAFIKARAIAGDIALGEEILRELRPFVWRRYLDFAAIADIHAMKRQIDAHRGHGAIAVEGHNVKLGRGGIREIEFFAQTQQLIAGGRYPELRLRETVRALALLADELWITFQARDDLTAAYWFLREIEHRLQMVDDAQTHELPDEPEELERFARFCGYAGRDAFAAALTERLLLVQSHYARLFEQEAPLASQQGSLVFTGDSDDPETLETLARLGFAEPARASAMVRGWHHGRYTAMVSPRARELLTELIPGLLDAFAATGAADEALLGFDRMLSHVTAGVSLLSILRTNPTLLDLMASIFGSAPRLAEIIGRRPRVLDAVMDPRFFGEIPSAVDIEARFAAALSQATGYEDLLNRARIVGQEQQTLIGVRQMSGTLNAGQAGAAYSLLAEITVRLITEAVERELARVHGRVPGGQVAVLGFGRLGAGEMTATSDLDLVLVYRHASDATQSDGERPLAPSAWYGRLTQRLVAALSAPTAEGLLYPVDMRLRPSGRAGPLAVSFDAFRSYHVGGEAETWERMALTRARVMSAPADLRAEIDTTIAAILGAPRDTGKLARDVRDMRRMISGEKGEGDRWDVKLAAGGLVDIEFLAQFLVLAFTGKHPDLPGGSTLQVLDRARRLGLIEAPDHDLLRRSLRLQHEITQLLRLSVSGAFTPEGASQSLRRLLLRATGNPSFESMETELEALQDQTRAVFMRLLG